jgi:hypothetical protein
MLPLNESVRKIPSKRLEVRERERERERRKELCKCVDKKECQREAEKEKGIHSLRKTEEIQQQGD